MAAYSLTVSSSCASPVDGGGVLTCQGVYSIGGPDPDADDFGDDAMLLLDSSGSVVDVQPMPRTAPSCQFTGVADGGPYALQWRNLSNANGTLLASATAGVDCDPGGGGPGGGGTSPVLGCTSQNALNFDPAATQDTSPTACVFVAVDVAPSGLVAAHLPIALLLRVSPTLAGLASIVVVLLDTAPTLAGPWLEFGQLKAVCNDAAQVVFNLSEAAKSLLRINPPAESGPDASLSVLVRVRYQVYDPATGAPTYAGEAATFRALNAVQQASSGTTLTTPTPYTARPDGGQLWTTTATYAGGVVTALLPKPSDGCKARQFVWLNAAGAWDTGFFFGRHAHGTDQADPIIYRDLAGADRYASRGAVRDTIQVYSDVTNWATYKLLRGIRQCIQAYERLGPGQYVPVLLSAESFPEYTEQTDKTFQVNFTVSYPAQLIQTQ